MTAQAGMHVNRITSHRTRIGRVFSMETRRDCIVEPGRDRVKRTAGGAHSETAFRVARTRRELRAAYRLVYQIYLNSGFTKHADHGMRVTPYHALPGTDVFVAEQAGRVACTMTLIGDSELGLPAETLYADEVAGLRDSGRRIAEVGSLAQRGHDLSCLLRLINLMAQRAKLRGVDDLLITVHPRHAKFYQRYLGFEMIGPLRSYQAVCGQPAVAMAVNLSQLYFRDQRACCHLFGAPFFRADLTPPPLDAVLRAEVLELTLAASELAEPCPCG